MKNIFLFLAIVVSTQNYSQINFTDSMRTIIFKNSKDSTRFVALNLLAVHFLTNNLDSAKRYGKIMFEIAEKIGNKRGIARAYAYLGDVAAKTNNYAEQINYLSKALKLMEESKDTEGIIRVNTRLSGVYATINDNENAILHAKKSIKLLSTQNETVQRSGLGLANVALGEIYLKNNDPANALIHFKTAYKSAINEAANAWHLARVTEGLAKTYSALNDNKNAKSYYNKALALNKHSGSISGIMSCRQGLADLLINESRPDSALAEIKQAELLAIRQKDKSSLLKTYDQYILLYEKQGNYKKQSEYLSMKVSLKDSINTLVFSKALADAKIKLRNEEKERENILLQEKNNVLQLQIENTRNRVLLIFAATLCLIFALLFRNAYNKLKSQQKNMELENTLLRFQMNPHFVFNSLSSIQSFVLSEDPLKAAKYLAMFAKLMRNSLNNSRREFVSLVEEVELLDVYVQLEKTRIKKELSFSIEYDIKELKNLCLPPMLVQPHIENAIKHGMKDHGKHNKIEVTFVLKDKLLYCKIEDNGIGITKSLAARQVEKNLHESAALSLTKTRLELLCKKLKFPFKFAIKDVQEFDKNRTGTIVEFLVPYKYEIKSLNS